MEAIASIAFRLPNDKRVLLNIDDGIDACVAIVILSMKLAPSLEEALKMSTQYTLKADFQGMMLDLR